MSRPARAVFLGSGSFAIPIVEAVASHETVQLVAVVSAQDRPSGRGRRVHATPVATLARARGWTLHQPARLRDPEAEARILELRPDILLLADYGRIVPAALLDAPRGGALNVHPSLLPRFRGASPIPATILAGDRETGVTIIRMDAGIDTGPIIAQERLPVGGAETAPELEQRLAAAGARLLADVLGEWLDGSVAAVPQPARGATFTRPLRREDGRLDWTRPARALERQVRAYQPWPGSFTASPIGTITVWRAAVAASGGGRGSKAAIALGHREPGTVLPFDHGIAATCADDVLELLEVQMAGRRRVGGAELRSGHPQLVGARLG